MGYDETSKKSTIKYIKDKQQEIKVRYKKTDYEQDILPVIEKSGLPVATYIKKAVSEKIELDKKSAQDADEKLASVKKATLKAIPEIMKDDCRQIILYGSYARGDYNDDSDIDIAILTNSNRAEVKKYDDSIDEVATQICQDTMAIVNYVCLPYLEYEKKKSWYPYFMNIARDGVVLYGRS
ncbi:MAG: nucleotidyltransferase domain-containing protein [Lachnospiraceae bacterium]|nr:nucleotidyltransferase domain-containing protein [Lachnospiraceae bacterium]